MYIQPHNEQSRDEKISTNDVLSPTNQPRRLVWTLPEAGRWLGFTSDITQPECGITRAVFRLS